MTTTSQRKVTLEAPGGVANAPDPQTPRMGQNPAEAGTLAQAPATSVTWGPVTKAVSCPLPPAPPPPPHR